MSPYIRYRAKDKRRKFLYPSSSRGSGRAASTAAHSQANLEQGDRTQRGGQPSQRVFRPEQAPIGGGPGKRAEPQVSQTRMFLEGVQREMGHGPGNEGPEYRATVRLTEQAGDAPAESQHPQRRMKRVHPPVRWREEDVKRPCREIGQHVSDKEKKRRGGMTPPPHEKIAEGRMGDQIRHDALSLSAARPGPGGPTRRP